MNLRIRQNSPRPTITAQNFLGILLTLTPHHLDEIIIKLGTACDETSFTTLKHILRAKLLIVQCEKIKIKS